MFLSFEQKTNKRGLIMCNLLIARKTENKGSRCFEITDSTFEQIRQTQLGDVTPPEGDIYEI